MALVDPGARAPASHSRPRPASAAGPHGSTASASSSVTSRSGRQGSTPAAKHASAFQMFPMPGDVALVEQGVAEACAWDRPRAGARRNPALVELVGQHVRPEPREALVEARARRRSSAPARGRRTAPPRARPCGSRARRDAGRAASAGRAGRRPRRPPMRRCECSVRSPSKRTKRCLPWASTARTARPASRSGQRSMPCRGCGVSIDSICGAQQCRADAVRRVMDRVALGHDALERCTRHWRHSRRPPR